MTVSYLSPCFLFFVYCLIVFSFLIPFLSLIFPWPSILFSLKKKKMEVISKICFKYNISGSQC